MQKTAYEMRISAGISDGCSSDLDQRGNAFMLTAAAVVPLIGIVGSAVDIGRAYMTQLRLQQACDAGVLAGRRSMAGGTYTDAAEAEANKMFNLHFPAGIYGSRDRKSTRLKSSH